MLFLEAKHQDWYEICGMLFQVLHVVKTRQVTYSVLSKFIDYIQDLEKTGLLQEKDLRFHEAVQVAFSCALLAAY